MSRIMGEPKRHIHEELCGELNQMSILLKMWDSNLFDNQSEEQQIKILEFRRKNPQPQTGELLDLIECSRNELHAYVMPYIVKR